jgi:hypothetical protein
MSQRRGVRPEAEYEIRHADVPVHVVLFQIRQQERRPTPARIQSGGTIRGRERAVRTFVVVQCEGLLLQVVRTLRAGRGFPHLLHGGQQQTNQDGNDGNHDQQLDQREP